MAEVPDRRRRCCSASGGADAARSFGRVRPRRTRAVPAIEAISGVCATRNWRSGRPVTPSTSRASAILFAGACVQAVGVLLRSSRSTLRSRPTRPAARAAMAAPVRWTRRRRRRVLRPPRRWRNLPVSPFSVLGSADNACLPTACVPGRPRRPADWPVACHRSTGSRTRLGGNDELVAAERCVRGTA